MASKCKAASSSRKIDRRAEFGFAVRADAVDRQSKLLGRAAIVRNHIDQFRRGAGFFAEGGQPAGPEIAVRLEIALIEEDDDRLVGLGGGAEELFDGGVVVFLLREDRHEHVGRLADGLGAGPIHQRVGIDVGRIEHQQPRRHALAAPPEKAGFPRLPRNGSSADCQGSSVNGSKSFASKAGSSNPSGTRHTGCLVPEARGVAALAFSPAR